MPSWRRSIAWGLVAWAISLFMASPPIDAWNWSSLENSRAGDFLRQCAHPLTRDLHEGILEYRIATPVLAWLLHLPPVLALGAAYVFSLATLIALHRVASRKLSPECTSALTIAVACSSTMHFTHWLPGVPDSLTHLCSVAALAAPPVVTAIATAIGGMNDERMLLALPFIALWRWDNLPPNARTMRNTAAAVLPLVSGLLVILVLRHALAAGWIGAGIRTPKVYLEFAAQVRNLTPRLGSWGVWFANWALGPGWLWLPVAWPWFSGAAPSRSAGLVHAAAFAGICLASFVVADAARTIGFAFPAAPVGATWLFRQNPSRARSVLLSACALQVCTPAIWLYERWQFLQFRPLLWELKLCLG